MSHASSTGRAVPPAPPSSAAGLDEPIPGVSAEVEAAEGALREAGDQAMIAEEEHTLALPLARRRDSRLSLDRVSMAPPVALGGGLRAGGTRAAPLRQTPVAWGTAVAALLVLAAAIGYADAASLAHGDEGPSEATRRSLGVVGAPSSPR